MTITYAQFSKMNLLHLREINLDLFEKAKLNPTEETLTGSMEFFKNWGMKHKFEGIKITTREAALDFVLFKNSEVKKDEEQKQL